MAEDVDSHNYTISMQYDDYKTTIGEYNAADSSVAANDYLEIVEKNSLKYFHAKGIGSGEIIIDEETVQITVSKAKLSVFLVIGQSNATPELSDSSTIYPGMGTAY